MSDEIKIVSVEEMAEKIMQTNSWYELRSLIKNEMLGESSKEKRFALQRLYNEAILTSVKVQTHIAGLPQPYITRIVKVETIGSVKEMARQLMQLSTGKDYFEFMKALETSNPAASTEGLPDWAKQYKDARKDPKVQAHIERLISDGSRARQQARAKRQTQQSGNEHKI